MNLPFLFNFPAGREQAALIMKAVDLKCLFLDFVVQLRKVEFVYSPKSQHMHRRNYELKQSLEEKIFQNTAFIPVFQPRLQGRKKGKLKKWQKMVKKITLLPALRFTLKKIIISGERNLTKTWSLYTDESDSGNSVRGLSTFASSTMKEKKFQVG